MARPSHIAGRSARRARPVEPRHSDPGEALLGIMRQLLRSDAGRTLLRELVEDALADVQPTDEYLCTARAAQIAGVAQGTIRRWVRTRRLTAYHAGRPLRVRRDDLEALLAGEKPQESETPEERARRLFGA